MMYNSMISCGDTDIMVRDVIVSVSLKPVYWNDPPESRITFNDQILWQGKLLDSMHQRWTLPAQDVNRFSVWFLNKTEQDTRDGLDKAIVIDRVGLEDLELDSFRHRARYRPQYTLGFLESRAAQGQVPEPVISADYLGFNGEWWIEWPWPTFSWIYGVETNDLGWVYEKNI